MLPIYLESSGDLSTISSDAQAIILTAEYINYVLSLPVTIGSLTEHLDFTPEYISTILMLPTTVEILSARGIQVNDSSTPEKQFTFLLCLFNPLDTRSHKQIMADLGVTLAEFYGWQHSNRFKQLQSQLAADFFSNAGLFVDRELIRRALGGSAPHMRIYYEQKNNQQMNPRVIVQRLVDVVQKHIKDPEIQKNIAQELIGSARQVRGQVE